VGKAENDDKAVGTRKRKASREQEARKHDPGPDESSSAGSGEDSTDGLLAEADELLVQVRAQVEGAGEEFQRFLGLIDAFADVIPEEHKRYAAAIKALAPTTGLAVKEVLDAAERQLSELEGQREGFSEVLSRWREDLHLHASKSREIRSRIAALEKEIRELEAMEKGSLAQLVTGEKEVARAEARLDSLADKLQTDIETARQKILDTVAAESAPTAKAQAPREKKEPAGKAPEPPEAEEEGGGEDVKESDNRKICSDCKCPMDWHEIDKKWKCFVCANEAD
jgi:hypothetical protein